MIKYFHIFLIFLVSFISQIQLSGQKLDWHLQPVFTDVDDVDLEMSEKNRILVKKDRLRGVKTTTNEVIIPVQYKDLHIYHENNVISASDGKKMFYFDSDGYASTEELWTKANNALSNKNKQKQREYTLNSNKLYGIKVKGHTSYINKNLDTILRLTASNDPILFDDKYYATKGFDGKSTHIYHKNGNLYKILDFSPANLNFNRGFYTCRFKHISYLLDSDFNEIMQSLSGSIRVDDSLDVIIFEHDKKYFITDFKLNKIINDTFPAYPHIIKNTSLILFPLPDRTVAVNVATKKSESYPFTTRTNDRTGTKLIIKENGKNGVYDFLNNNYLIPTKFDFMTHNNGYFIGKYGEKNTKHNEVLNGSGRSLYEGHCFSINVINEGFIITDTLRKIDWYDNTGKILKQFSAEYTLNFNPSSSTVTVLKKNEPSKTYFIHEYLSLEKPQFFEEIGERLNPKMKENVPIYSFKNKGKFGIIDSKGKIIIEPLFSRNIQVWEDKWVVEYNNKIGVLNLPKTPLKS